MSRIEIQTMNHSTSDRCIPWSTLAAGQDKQTHERDTDLFDKFTTRRNVPRANFLARHSLSLHDIDRQTTTDASAPFDVEEDEDDDEVDEDLPKYSHLDKRGRRMSKSLPELRDVRLHLPGNLGLEPIREYDDYEDSEYDEDNDSVMTQDVSVRPNWRSRSAYVMTLVGLSLGLNNLWRFPYLCYNNHGGAFMAAYLILTLTCGLPLLCMEYAVGQLTKSCAIRAFGHLCPILKGVTFGGVYVACILSPIYSAINSWSLFYFFKSFNSSTPWSSCTSPWNSPICGQKTSRIMTDLQQNGNDTADVTSSILNYLNETNNLPPNFHLPVGDDDNGTSLFGQLLPLVPFAAEEFFNNRLLELDLKDGSYLGEVRWDLFVFLIVTWLVTFIAQRKNILFSAHATFFLAIVPYLMLVIMLIGCVMLDGARDGLVYFLRPSWDDFSDPDVWLYAAGFCFHTLGTVIGTSVALATCNKHNNNFLRDSVVTCLINIVALLVIGSLVFATLGHLAHTRNIDITQVLPHDPSFAFVIYSELLSLMPMPSLCSAFFFLVIFFVGTDYQISIVETVLNSIENAYGSFIKRRFYSHQLFLFVLCIVFLLMSVILVTQKGIYLIELLDHYIAILLVVILSFFEVILVGWFYGGKSLGDVIRQKTAKSLGIYFPLCWSILTPTCILFILIRYVCSYHEIEFRHLRYAFVMLVVAHMMVIFGILLIPTVAYLQILRTPKTNIILRIIRACKTKGDKKVDILINGKCVNNNPIITVEDVSNSNFNVTRSIMQGLNRETNI